MQTILITGGAGFIGSNLAASLSQQPDVRVVICDSLGSGEKWRNLAKHAVDEVITPENLFYWLEAYGGDVAAIVHLAAVTTSSEKETDRVLEANFTLSRMLWQWAAAQGVRFIYGSSATTYGDGGQGFEDDSSLAYLSRLRPLTAPAWTKHLFDMHVARRVEEGEAVPPQWVGLKFFNIYGPNEYHKDGQRSVMCQWLPHAEKGHAIKLFKSDRADYKDGAQKRDFLYVDDAVSVMRWLLANPTVSGLFNCGSGISHSFNQVAETIYRVVGKEAHIGYSDMPDHIRNKYQYYTQADMSKLRAAGYTAEMASLEEGITEYYRRYLSTDDPYR